MAQFNLSLLISPNLSPLIGPNLSLLIGLNWSKFNPAAWYKFKPALFRDAGVQDGALVAAECVPFWLSAGKGTSWAVFDLSGTDTIGIALGTTPVAWLVLFLLQRWAWNPGVSAGLSRTPPKSQALLGASQAISEA